MTLRTISYGGGVQSTALVVLAAQGVIDFPVALFANVGDDSEHPATLEYVRNVAVPWAAERGVTIHEVQKVRRDGTKDSLLRALVRKERSIDIPVRMANGAPGNRNCTHTFKIGVLDRWLREQGATAEDPATVALGISTDELERAGRGRGSDLQERCYPLLDLGLDRSACERVIRDAGLPVPPKSACWFCPFKRPAEWQTMAREAPNRFAMAVQMETMLNARRDVLGKDHVYLTRFGKPLDQAINDSQQAFDFGGIGEDGCDEGVCFV